MNSNGDLVITIHIVSNNNGSWCKSRKKIEFTITEEKFTILESEDIETPKVNVTDLHCAIIKYFGKEAKKTISAIESEQDPMTESSLIGDNHANFNVRM